MNKIVEIFIYFYAISIGFTEKESHTLTCIAKHESSLNSKAVNKNKNGTTDHGLLQINDLWQDLCKDLDLYNVKDNII